MILTTSNAHHLYWLGRYLTRLNLMCGLLPFNNDLHAENYAAAFCLPAYDAASLNTLLLDQEQPFSLFQQFQIARENIFALRAIFTPRVYASLNAMIKTAMQRSVYICDIVSDCTDILEGEAPDVFLFYALGRAMERLDHQLRLDQATQITLKELEDILTIFHGSMGHSFDLAWQMLKQQPSLEAFFQLSDQLEHVMEECA